MELAPDRRGRAGAGGLKCTSTKFIVLPLSIASLRTSARTSIDSTTSPLKMDVKDGVIWVYGLGDRETMAFTDFGIETLAALNKIHRDASATS